METKKKKTDTSALMSAFSPGFAHVPFEGVGAIEMCLRPGLFETGFRPISQVASTQK